MLIHALTYLLLSLAMRSAHATADATKYLGPVAVIASKDGSRLFVANADARQVSIVDAADGKLLRSILLPAPPTGMVLSPDGAAVYVTCAAPRSTVCVLDADSGRVSASISAGHTAIGPAISPDGARLYVCNRFNNDVSVIDLAEHREVARVAVGREPTAAAVTPDGRFIYVASHLPQDRSNASDVAATVSVIGAAGHGTATIRLPNGSTSVRGLCISPEGKHVFVVHVLARYQLPVTQPDRGWMNTSAMSVIDTSTQQLVGTVLLDDVDRGAANPWGVTTTADGATILVSHSGTHELSAIDAKRLLEKLARVSASPTGVGAASDLSFLVGLRRRIGLEGLGPRGLAAIGSKVFAAEYFSDTLGVVDLAADGPGRVGQIALGPEPKLTAARRGELVFHDARRSFQHWQSCATCHPDGRADGLNWDLLNDGLGNPKNTRSMLLVHQGGPAMSLGVRATAESAVRAGFIHSLFATTREADAVAVDTYLKSLTPVLSPHLIDGRLSPAAQRGKELFFDPKVGCANCHSRPAYTDKKLHNVASQGKLDDPNDKFTTPRLIEVWRTAPYMHDGQYLTVKELLVEGKHGHNADEAAQLSDDEIDDLVEFVLSL